MKKRTDSQLLKELRINTFILAVAMIIIFIVSFFLTDIGEYTYRFFLLILGLLLLSYSSQKYLNEHPKVLAWLLVILIIFALLGVVVFFMVS